MMVRRRKHWLVRLAIAMVSHRWGEQLVRLYAVAVVTIAVLSIPLFLQRFVPPRLLLRLFRTYGSAVERADAVMALASFVLAATGCMMCTGWLVGEREPSPALQRLTLAAIVLVFLHLVLVFLHLVLVFLHLVLVPAIMVP